VLCAELPYRALRADDRALLAGSDLAPPVHDIQHALLLVHAAEAGFLALEAIQRAAPAVCLLAALAHYIYHLWQLVGTVVGVPV
jgi:hypothetical protein